MFLIAGVTNKFSSNNLTIVGRVINKFMSELISKRDLCLKNILFVMKNIRARRSSTWSLSFLRKLLGSSLVHLKILFSASGLALGVFLSTPSSTKASETKLKASVPVDFDLDGDIDIIDADSSNSLKLIRNNNFLSLRKIYLVPILRSTKLGSRMSIRMETTIW